MTSHDTCSGGTSRVLTGASLQRLKLEAHIPAPADSEVRSVIKFWVQKAQCRSKFIASTASSHFSQISRSLMRKIVMEHLLFRKLCPRWLPKQLTSEHKAKRMNLEMTMWSIFFYTLRNSCTASVFIISERRRWVSQWFQCRVADFYDAGIQKLIPRFRRLICWKKAQYILHLFQ